MSFTASFILVLFTACFYSFVGYRWGKKDARKKQCEISNPVGETFSFEGATLKAVKDDSPGTEGCEQCFFASYNDCGRVKRENGLPPCNNPKIRFIMIKNDTKE